MNKRQILALLFAGTVMAAGAQIVKTVKVTNPSDLTLRAYPVVMQLNETVGMAIVEDDNTIVPCQLDDLNGDKRFDELCFLTDLKPHERKTFTVMLNHEGMPLPYEPQVYAEMLLTNKKIKEENKQDLYISSLTVERGTNPYWQLHHHGPAFENSLVAYRIYFDHRQTVDIYGKYREGLELHDTQFYPDSLQKATGYGDDVLWVGSTIGLGTLRGWNGTEPVMLEDVAHRTLRILARGPLRTIVEVVDEGWNVPSQVTRHASPITMTTRYTLYAGRRDCMVDIRFEDTSDASDQFCTGIINVKGSTEFTDHDGLRGCWGTDWPVSAKDSAGHKRETVGLGICIPAANVVSELPKDKRNYPYVVKPQNGELHYAITFCSDNEQAAPTSADAFGRIHSAADWFAYLREWKQRLSVNVNVEY